MKLEKCLESKWGPVALAAVVAALVAALFACLFSGTVWKLSQQTLFYADWDGLKEMLERTRGPGGLLSWLARGLQVTGLGWLGVPVYALSAVGTVLLWRWAFPRSRSGVLPLLAFPAALLAIYPAVLAGTSIWLVDDYSAGFRNVLGLWMALGVFVVSRRTRLWLGALVAVALYPLMGVYPLLGVVAADWRTLPLLALPACVGWCYYDLLVSEMYMRSLAIIDRLRWCALNVWSVLAFLLMLVAGWLERAEVRVAEGWSVRGRKGMILFAGAGVAMVCALFLSRPMPDLRTQFERERAIVEQRWEDVLAIKPANGNALRMETAYRVLALHRLGRLPGELFDEPHWSSQESTDAQEELMDGHELLFAYGLLLPARRYLFETMSTKYWMPRHFQLLGDIAFIQGEQALAERNYRQLMRCPYYGAVAASRLADLRAHRLPKPLEPVAILASTINAMLKKVDVEFFDIEQNVERLVYNHFVNISNCDAATAKFCIASMLLKKKHDTLALNRALLEGLFGSASAVPECVQQALLVSGKYPLEAISPAVREKAMAFQNAAQRVNPSNQDAFLRKWAGNYLFYNEFVK